MNQGKKNSMKTIKLFLVFLSFNFVVYAQDKQSPSPTEKEALVKVTVTNFQNVPRPNDIIIFEGTKNNTIHSGITDAKGKFSILLPKGEVYNIKYKDFTDSTDYSKFEIPNAPGRYISELTIQIEPPKYYTLDNVFFDIGLATLEPSSFKALNDLVEVMKLKSTLVIEIAGHTDNTGTQEINKKLSQDRADAVRDYLIKNGITADRVTAKGYGDTEPVADNSTEEGRQKNRRTEVRIIKE